MWGLVSNTEICIPSLIPADPNICSLSSWNPDQAENNSKKYSDTLHEQNTEVAGICLDSQGK